MASAPTKSTHELLLSGHQLPPFAANNLTSHKLKSESLNLLSLFLLKLGVRMLFRATYAGPLIWFVHCNLPGRNCIPASDLQVHSGWRCFFRNSCLLCELEPEHLLLLHCEMSIYLLANISHQKDLSSLSEEKVLQIWGEEAHACGR